jgi:REP element-mobilizing transposase RayT
MGDGDVKRRKPMRLPGFDYSQPGYYFVTVRVSGRTEWFGVVDNNAMVLNGWGRIVWECWRTLPVHHPGILLDEFIVMPDHMHGIVVIGDTFNAGAGPARPLPSADKRCHEILPVVMGSFKSAVSRSIRSSDGGGHFRWQRSYHDHVIRDGAELSRIREYIRDNPAEWASGRGHGEYDGL